MMQERCRKAEHDGVEGECYGCAREAEAAGQCGNCYGRGCFNVDPDCFCDDDDCTADHLGQFDCSACRGTGRRDVQLQVKAAKQKAVAKAVV